jgi:hypothetical protein
VRMGDGWIMSSWGFCINSVAPSGSAAIVTSYNRWLLKFK